jgi:hypothetical protein
MQHARPGQFHFPGNLLLGCAIRGHSDHTCSQLDALCISSEAAMASKIIRSEGDTVRG